MAPPIKATEWYGSGGVTVGGGLPNWGKLKSEKDPRADQAPNHSSFHAGGRGAVTVPAGETGVVKFRFGVAAEYVFNGRETESPSGVLPTAPPEGSDGDNPAEPFAPEGDEPRADPDNPPDEPLPPNEEACFPGDPCAENPPPADDAPPAEDPPPAADEPKKPAPNLTSPKDYNYSGENYHATSHGLQITGSADVVVTPVDTGFGENTLGFLAGAQLAYRHMWFVSDGSYANGDERVPLALVSPAWGTHQVLKSSSSVLAGPRLGVALDTKNVDAALYGYALWSITSDVSYEVPGREVPEGAEESATLTQSHSLEEFGVAADVLFHSARATAPVVPPPPPPEDDKATPTDARIVLWNSFLDKNREKIAALGMPGPTENLRAVWMPVPVHGNSANPLEITDWTYALVIQTGIPRSTGIADNPATADDESIVMEWAVLLKAPSAGGVAVAKTLTIDDLNDMLALEEAKAEKTVVESESVVTSFERKQLAFKVLRPGPSTQGTGKRPAGETDQAAIAKLLVDNALPAAANIETKKTNVRAALKDILDKASIDHLIAVAIDLMKPEHLALRFDLVGHSSVDNYSDNEALSKRRAELVKAVFVAMGVAADRIGIVEGKGKTEPKYTAKKDNAKNQRVVLIPLDAGGNRVDSAKLETLKTKVSAATAISAADVKWSKEVHYRTLSMDKAGRKATDTHVSFNGADGEWGVRTNDVALATNVPLKYFHDPVSSLTKEQYTDLHASTKAEVEKFTMDADGDIKNVLPIANVTNRASYDGASRFIRERKEAAAKIRGDIATIIAAIPAAGAGAPFTDVATRTAYIDSLKALDKTLADALAPTGVIGKYEIALEAKAKTLGLTATNQIKDGTFPITDYVATTGKGIVSLEGTSLVATEIEIRKGTGTTLADFRIEEDAAHKQLLKIPFPRIMNGFTYTVYKKGSPATKLGVITVAVVAGAATATYKAEAPVAPPAPVAFNPTADIRGHDWNAGTHKGKIDLPFTGTELVDIIPVAGGSAMTLSTTVAAGAVAAKHTFEFTAAIPPAAMVWKIVKRGTANLIDAPNKYILLTFAAAGNPDAPRLFNHLPDPLRDY